MNSTIAPYQLKRSEEKNYDNNARNKMYLQPKTSSISNKITFRPSHVNNNYSPSNTSRPQYAGPPPTSTQSYRINNGGTIQQTQSNTQPLNGQRLYTNGNSNSSRGSLASRGTASSLSERSAPTFGKYKLIREIGKGNFAKVKLAQHLVTGKEVAVKIIDKTKLNSSALQKLTREVKVMKELNHPNIVRLYEVIQTERSLYLVMEFAPNGEVFEHLVKHGRLKEKDARAKFRQILSAVQYCHQKMIVHRDLKAENLLLDKDMSIKIADFGFSNHYSPQSKLNTFCGSPPYAAPELFQGRRYEGPEVDVWSLGVIMYTLISGSLPFDGGTLKELRERVLRGKYRIPFYMSSDSETLLRKMLVLNPQKRLPLHEIMKDLWVNIGYEDSMLRPYIEPEIDYNDSTKIDALINMGFTRQQIMDALLQKRYDSITAIYLLWDQSVQRTLAKPATQIPNYGSNRNGINFAPLPSSVPTSTMVPEISSITKNQYAHDILRPHTNCTKFTRKTNEPTVTSSAKDDDTVAISSNNGVPGPYDFTQSNNHRPNNTNVARKPRPLPLRNLVMPAHSNATVTSGASSETAENNQESDLNNFDVSSPERFSDTSGIAEEDEDQLTETEEGSSSNKLIEPSFDDIEVPKTLSFSGSSANKPTAKVKRNHTFNDYLSTKTSLESSERKGVTDQTPLGYNLFPNQPGDALKNNSGFTNTAMSTNSTEYDQDSFGDLYHNSKMHRSNSSNPRSNNNTFKQISLQEPMDRLVEEPDNDLDINSTQKVPANFQRSVNGYQSLRLPDMVPPYQANTGSQCYSKFPQKEDPQSVANAREQSPFSRNTPERATIQSVPHNTRERNELEKAVLSGVGRPSGPSNLPVALGGSISHPQPPKKDKLENQENLSGQNQCPKEKKKSGVKSFFNSLTTKMTKKKLSNASPTPDRYPSPTDNPQPGYNSIQRSQTNQFHYVDNNDQWSNHQAVPSPSPSPFFQDRPAGQTHTNKASNYDTENLIISSSATSLTSSASSVATHGNRTQNKPRTFRFSFSTEVTSKKSADELISEIKRVLVAFHIDYELKSGFLLLCSYGDSSEEVVIQWEVEVVKLSSKSMNGIRFKRIHGPQMKFKEISKRIVERLQL